MEHRDETENEVEESEKKEQERRMRTVNSKRET